MSTGHRTTLLAPWAGLALGGLGWAMSQSIASWVFDDCVSSWPLPALIFTLLGLAIAALGLWLSWGSRRLAAKSGRFVGLIATMAAAGLILATLFHLAATLIIPRCLT